MAAELPLSTNSTQNSVQRSGVACELPKLPKKPDIYCTVNVNNSSMIKINPNQGNSDLSINNNNSASNGQCTRA